MPVRCMLMFVLLAGIVRHTDQQQQQQQQQSVLPSESIWSGTPKKVSVRQQPATAISELARMALPPLFLPESTALEAPKPLFDEPSELASQAKALGLDQEPPKPLFEPHFNMPRVPKRQKRDVCRRAPCLSPGTFVPNVLHDVCILDSASGYTVQVGNDKWRAQKRVHVFNRSPQQLRVDLQFGEEANTGTGKVDVMANPGRPPKPYEGGGDIVAYFLGTTCEANIDHFLGDSLVYLHASAVSTGMIPAKLGSTKLWNQRAANKSMLFWNRDLESYDRRMGPMGGFCHNPSAFEDILSTYGLAARPTAYWQVSRPMCFKHAVFVGASGRASAREALTYAAGQMGADACPPTPQVTIFNRQETRRIMNVDALEALLRSVVNHSSTPVVVQEFEDASIAEQISAARCSGLVIGVHGAAMAWSAAMHPLSALVEISWDGWEFYYSCPGYAVHKAHGVCRGQSKYGVKRTAFFRVERQKLLLQRKHEALVRKMPKAPREKFLSANIDLGKFRRTLRDLFPVWPPRLTSWGNAAPDSH